MVKVIQGERVAKNGKLTVDSIGVLFNPERQKILLTQRSDDKRWCLPGGHMDPGESAEEACIREVQEETGLQVQVNRLIGVYSSPHMLVEFPDGRREHVVGLSFETQSVGGTLRTTESTSSFGYFSKSEIEGMDVLEHHRPCIADAFAGQIAAFVR